MPKNESSLLLCGATFRFSQESYDRVEDEEIHVETMDEGGGIFFQLSTPDNSVWTASKEEIMAMLTEIEDTCNGIVDRICERYENKNKKEEANNE